MHTEGMLGSNVPGYVDRGGHFAALERPRELVTEIREFFRPLRA
jgi:hypothetical protein